MLEATDIPGTPNASWDRKAAWLFFNREGTKPMARKKSVNEVATKLLDVLKFTSLGYKSTGDVQAQHTWFSGGWVLSFDGVIAAGTPVEGLDFEAYAHTGLLTEALSNVGKEMDLAINDSGIAISSGDYSVVVPQGDRTSMRPTPPDQNIAPIGAGFIDAMELCGRIVKDTAPLFRDAVIVTRDKTVLSCDGMTLIEAHHGYATPPGLMFPKQFANALKKSGKTPIGFGFGAETFTIWFDDNSFLRTQLYTGRGENGEPLQYPAQVLDKLEHLMQAPTNDPVLPGFFEAVAKVVPFAMDEKHTIHLKDGNVSSGFTSGSTSTASLPVANLPDGTPVNGERLLTFSDVTKTIWYGSEEPGARRMVLNGQNEAGNVFFRAAISGNAPPAAPAPVEAAPDPSQPSLPAWGQPVTTAPAAAPAMPAWGQGGASSTASPAPSPQAETSPLPAQSAPVGEGDQSQTIAETSPSSPLPAWGTPTPSVPSAAFASPFGQTATAAHGVVPDAAPQPQAPTNAASPTEGTVMPAWGTFATPAGGFGFDD